MKNIILLFGILALAGCTVPTREELAATTPVKETVVKADKYELIKCTNYRMQDKWKSTSLISAFGPQIVVEQTNYGNVTELIGLLSGTAYFIMTFSDQEDQQVKISHRGEKIFKNEPWEILESCMRGMPS